MARLRALFCVVLSAQFVLSTAMGAATPAIGTVTSAVGAHVGATSATVGATIFDGDKLSTQETGTLQIRAGAARLMLSGASTATIADASGTPSATLQQGTAIFSTANARAFVLHASTADIRPATDAPTVAQVTYVNSKELVVRSTRGSVAITVEGETQTIPEAGAYRVVLDPDSYLETAATPAQGPAGAGAERTRNRPLSAGRSRFLLIAIVLSGVATGVALYEVLESPHKP